MVAGETCDPGECERDGCGDYDRVYRDHGVYGRHLAGRIVKQLWSFFLLIAFLTIGVETSECPTYPQIPTNGYSVGLNQGSGIGYTVGASCSSASSCATLGQVCGTLLPPHCCSGLTCVAGHCASE